jgi:hypothetical protein
MKQAPALYSCKWESAFHWYSYFLYAFFTTHGYITGLYWSHIQIYYQKYKFESCCKNGHTTCGKECVIQLRFWVWMRYLAYLISCSRLTYDQFFFFFLRHYNFREVLAFPTNSFHLERLLMQFFQFVIFIFVMSAFTSSSYLFLGLPRDLVKAGDHSYTFFTMLLSGIRCTCPNQASLCALI